MSEEEISKRWKGFIIPDIGTVHYPSLVQAIKDIQFLLARNESLSQGWATEIRCHREALERLRHNIEALDRREKFVSDLAAHLKQAVSNWGAT